MKSPVLHAIMGPLRRRQSLAMTVYESERDAYQHLLQTHVARRRSRRPTTATAAHDRDPKFRQELLREGIECMLEGDLATAKTILRDWPV